MADDKLKQTAIHRLYRRLAGRERLFALAREAAPISEAARQLDRLRERLVEWATYQKPIESARTEPGIPLAAYMKDTNRAAAELLGGSNAWAMGIIDSSIQDLDELPDGREMQAALRARYLNEAISRDAGMAVRVIRHNRIQHLSLLEADALADRAETTLVPIVKRKGLPL